MLETVFFFLVKKKVHFFGDHFWRTKKKNQQVKEELRRAQKNLKKLENGGALSHLTKKDLENLRDEKHKELKHFEDWEFKAKLEKKQEILELAQAEIGKIVREQAVVCWRFCIFLVSLGFSGDFA